MDLLNLDEAIDRIRKTILPELDAILTDKINMLEAIMDRVIKQLDGASVTLSLKEQCNEKPSISPGPPGAIGPPGYGTGSAS